jgi:ABC-type dipeptide/oligopeptide/nickel transport system ATPase component
MDRNTRVIGLCGKAGAGKSTVARAIMAITTTDPATYGKGTIISFADPMRAMMAALFSGSVVQPNDPAFDKERSYPELGGRTYRHAMQTLGTEWGRNCMGPDFWLDLVQRRASAMQAAGVGLIVIDDVRFTNEANAIRAGGGMVVQLDRGLTTTALTSHASEYMAALNPDFAVDNTVGRNVFNVAQSVLDGAWLEP